jgi:hypothetical protein
MPPTCKGAKRGFRHSPGSICDRSSPQTTPGPARTTLSHPGEALSLISVQRFINQTLAYRSYAGPKPSHVAAARAAADTERGLARSADGDARRRGCGRHFHRTVLALLSVSLPDAKPDPDRFCGAGLLHPGDGLPEPCSRGRASIARGCAPVPAGASLPFDQPDKRPLPWLLEGPYRPACLRRA